MKRSSPASAGFSSKAGRKSANSSRVATRRVKCAADYLMFICAIRDGDFASASLHIQGWAFPRTLVRRRALSRGTVLGQFKTNPQFTYGVPILGNVAYVEGYQYERREEAGETNLQMVADHINSEEFEFTELFDEYGKCRPKSLTEHPN